MRTLLTPLIPALMATLSWGGPTAAAQGPDRILLDAQLKVTKARQASYYRVLEGVEGGAYLGRTYTMDGRLKAEGLYVDEQLTVENGRFTFFYANGQVESTGDYAHGLKKGVWQRFDAVGHALAEKVYDPEPLADIVYTRAETMPSYPGGDKELIRRVRSQMEAQLGERMKGEVTASFIVEKNGELSDVRVLEGEDAALIEKVKEVLKRTPGWEPGRDKGRPVRVQVQVPVDL